MAFNRRETLVLVVGDLLVLAASLWVALALRNFVIPELRYVEEHLVPFAPLFLLSIVVFYIAGLYEKQTSPVRRVMRPRVIGAQAANVVLAAFVFFLLPLNIAPKTILALYLGASVVLVSAWRWYRLNREVKIDGRTPAVLVGSGDAVDEVYEEVQKNTRYVVHFTGHVTVESETAESVTAGVERAIAKGAKVVVIDVSTGVGAEVAERLYQRLTHDAALVEFAAFYEDIFDRVPLDHVDTAVLLDAIPRDRAIYDTLKRSIDIIGAAIGCVLAAPIVAVAALALALDGSSPLIRPARVGRRGAHIHLWKLRTMLFDDQGDRELQAKNRVTKLGKWLRKTRIDELPQLLNVLAGDLSFIGPRPEIPSIVSVYEEKIPHYRIRHTIVPGLSGWAQIRDYDAPRGPADIERTRSKLSFDLYYLKHRSLSLDLAIALKTIRALVTFTGK